jgi:hypothetical protein
MGSGGAGDRVELRVRVRAASVAGPGGASHGGKERRPKRSACVGWVAVRAPWWRTRRR